jgi:hypothetical protein
MITKTSKKEAAGATETREVSVQNKLRKSADELCEDEEE